jgi:hypothetical protein
MAAASPNADIAERSRIFRAVAPHFGRVLPAAFYQDANRSVPGVVRLHNLASGDDSKGSGCPFPFPKFSMRNAATAPASAGRSVRTKHPPGNGVGYLPCRHRDHYPGLESERPTTNAKFKLTDEIDLALDYVQLRSQRFMQGWRGMFSHRYASTTASAISAVSNRNTDESHRHRVPRLTRHPKTPLKRIAPTRIYPNGRGFVSCAGI